MGRLDNQAVTAIDGSPFPRKQWESSKHYWELRWPWKVALGLTGKTTWPPAWLAAEREWYGFNLADVVTPPDFDLGLLNDEEKIEILNEKFLGDFRAWVLAEPIQAEWFVVHDTAGLLNLDAPPPDAKGISIFIGQQPKGSRQQGVALRHDFSAVSSGVKFETLHPEFRGKFIHAELNHIAGDAPCTDFQHEAIARAYIFASYRAGKFLTITSHREVDRGIKWVDPKRGIQSGHEDPRGFSFTRLYEMISEWLGMPSSATFGILQGRHDEYQKTYVEHINTFPVQYGAVRHEKILPIMYKGGKPGVIEKKAVKIVPVNDADPICEGASSESKAESSPIKK